MAKKKKNSRKKIFLLAVCLVVFLVCLTLFKPKQYQNDVYDTAESISAVTLFKNNFQPKASTKIYQASCQSPEGCVLHSPLDPAVEVKQAFFVENKVKLVDQGLGGLFANENIKNSKVFYDPFWRVYWVFGETETDMQFYGPYKLDN